MASITMPDPGRRWSETVFPTVRRSFDMLTLFASEESFSISLELRGLASGGRTVVDVLEMLADSSTVEIRPVSSSGEEWSVLMALDTRGA